ncbi:MAG TPA: addiction module protein [Longimicrobium sp.]|nr:addiction module protein [Longimicrobium sp.]
MSQAAISVDLATEELESAVLQLPRADRARLAERLLTSLDEDVRLEQIWAEEIRRRVEAVKSGRMATVPFEDTLEEIDDLLR